MTHPSTDIPRLQWQCRRGMLELDVLLERFLVNRYLSLLPEQQRNFQRLLSCSDQELWDWLVIKTALPEDQELQDLVELIRV